MLVSLLLITLPFVVYILLNFITVKVAGVKFGKAMPVTMICAVFLMIASHAVFHSFWPAIFIMFGISCVSVVLTVYGLCKLKSKESFTRFFENAFSNGFIAFIILWVMLILWDSGRRLAFYDEFAHWGMMVKTMLRLDDYYTIDASNMLVHKDYPPFSSIVNLIWVMIAGEYREKGCIMACHVYELSFLVLPIIDSVKNVKKWRSAACSAIIFAILVVIFTGVNRYFPSIYADIPLMCSVSYCMLLAADRDTMKSRFGQLAFILGNIATIFTKQTGIALALIPTFFLIWNIFINEDYRNTRWWKSLKCLLFLIPGAVMLKIWNGYVDGYHIYREFEMARADFKGAILDILNRTGGTYQTEFNSLMHALLWKNVLLFRFKMSYLGAFAVITIVIGLFAFSHRKNGLNKVVGLWVSLLLGNIGYILIMINTFVFFIVGRDLSGYGRYASTFVAMETVTVFMYYIYESMQARNDLPDLKPAVVTALIFVFAIGSKRLYGATSDGIDKGNIFKPALESAEMLHEVLPEDTSFYVLRYDKTDMSFMYQYVNDENRLNRDYYTEVFKIEETDTDKIDNIVRTVSSVDYLYVVDVPEILGAHLSVKDNGTLNEIGLYKVENVGGVVELVRQ